MDRTAAPCVNFFQYACGTWNRRHVIPEDRSSISTFEVLANQLQVILKRILEEPPNNEDNNATLKAKMFYKSCMDIRGYNENSFRTCIFSRNLTCHLELRQTKTKRRRKNEVLRLKSVLCLFVFTARIREIGDTPLRKTLEFLGGWPVVVGPSWKPPPYSVEVLLGRLRGQYNEGVLLEQWVGPDDKNSSANILQVRRQSKAPWSTTAQYN